LHPVRLSAALLFGEQTATASLAESLSHLWLGLGQPGRLQHLGWPLNLSRTNKQTNWKRAAQRLYLLFV